MLWPLLHAAREFFSASRLPDLVEFGLLPSIGGVYTPLSLDAGSFFRQSLLSVILFIGCAFPFGLGFCFRFSSVAVVDPEKFSPFSGRGTYFFRKLLRCFPLF